MACKFVGSALHESASSVHSSPNFQPQHTHPCHTPPDTPKHPFRHKHTNPTLDTKTLRTDIQALKNTIATKTKENSSNPLLATLKPHLNQMRKTLKQVYTKQNSAHLLSRAHELKITPFSTTINTARKLYVHGYDYPANVHKLRTDQ